MNQPAPVLITDDYWSKFFNSVDNFKLNAKKFSINEREKKLISDLTPQDANVRNYGWELTIKTDDYVILDIDFKEKSNQRVQVARTGLKRALLDMDVYLEESLHGGFHAIFRLDRKLSIVRKSISVVLKSFVFEFLKMAMVYPSTGYKLLKTPSELPPKEIRFEDFVSNVTRLLVDAETHLGNRIDDVLEIQDTVKNSFISIQPATRPPLFEEATEDDNDNPPSPMPVDSDDDLESMQPLQKTWQKRSNAADITKSVFESQAIEVAKTELGQDEKESIESQKLSPREAIRLRKAMNLMQKIYENAALYIDKLDAKFTFDLQDAILRFYAYFKKKADKNDTIIYGDDATAFFDFMFRADECDELHEGFWRKKSNSLFAPLFLPVLWREWLKKYCVFINFIETYNQNNGRNSRIQKFSDYKLYRKITLKNSDGANLLEEESRDQYYSWKLKTKNVFAQKTMRGAEVFTELVMFTLSVVKLDVNVIHYFLHYVNYVTDPGNYAYMCLERFFFSKLNNIDYRFKLIMEEGDRGVLFPVAVFNFKSYHWVKSNTEWFSIFISKCFPSLQSTTQFISLLNTQYSAWMSEEDIKFKKWKNMMPFENGVFDFNNYLTYEFSEASSTKQSKLSRTLSRQKSTGDKFSILQKYGVSVSVEDREKYESFSIFRNYVYRDAVLSPIRQEFDAYSYVCDFETTNLLSLTNYDRYSRAFCFYIRCLFGNNAHEALMGPFQWVRLIVFFIVLAQGLMRNKMFQTCLNLTGPGSNGKSVFIKMLTKLFGDKVNFIHCSDFFNSNETQQQGVGLEESLIVYDIEAETVNLSGFKSYVGDDVPQLKRRLYKVDVGRASENLSFLIACSNNPLKYHSPVFKEFDYDFAFHRRVTLLHFYNVLGITEKASIYSFDEDNEDDIGLSKKETLFKTAGFDLSSPAVIDDIILGLLYYLLDVLHVFNLPNLNASSHEMIISPLSSKRALGRANYTPLALLYREYEPVDEYLTDEKEIFETTHNLDLNEYVRKHYKNTIPFNLQSACESFERHFGIKYTKHVLDSDLMTEPETKFTLHGLKAKREMTDREFGACKNPNIYYDCSTLPKNMNAKQFVNHYLPKGHRFGFSSDIRSKVFETVKNLIIGERVEPSMKPCISNQYKEVTLKKLLLSDSDDPTDCVF